MQVEHDAPEKTPLWRVVALYAGFAATGIGVALPGALLPLLLARWHLQDEQGGRLFLMAWIGSSLGALSMRQSLRHALILGSFEVAAGAAGLALANGTGVDVLMALYGLGLGTTMTSISLIRQSQTAGSGTELVRLNLAWAIGACVCPSLTLHALNGGNFSPVLWSVCAVFALLSLSSFFQPNDLLRGTGSTAASAWATFRKVPLALIAMIFLVTGVEASGGAWLTTYTLRSGHHAVAEIAAPTCLWAGLLLSRLFWTLCGRLLTEPRIVLGSIALMSAASLLLISSNHGLTILLAASCLGFGLGPTYPLLLGWALRIQPGGAIFFVAGVGSACLPWLTGLLSAQQGSLRRGLLVPLAGSIAMLELFAFATSARRHIHG